MISLTGCLPLLRGIRCCVQHAIRRKQILKTVLEKARKSNLEVKYDSIIDEMIEDWLDHKQKLHFHFGLVHEENQEHVYFEFC